MVGDRARKLRVGLRVDCSGGNIPLMNVGRWCEKMGRSGETKILSAYALNLNEWSACMWFGQRRSLRLIAPFLHSGEFQLR
ncbi:hypothetical protein CRG98_033503 [Punica granatum]|uniref:Uncharacterized protein n=1 Tax=Punica granatum TaxID=22663 RepID=A0A2I0IQ21_PUNGR|nr:hypothetical protein CRG98_033503 [Punica granatum]